MFVGVRLNTTNVLDEAEQASSKISLQKLITYLDSLSARDSMSAAKDLPANFARLHYSKRDSSKAHHYLINVILYYKISLSDIENR